MNPAWWRSRSTKPFDSSAREGPSPAGVALEQFADVVTGRGLREVEALCGVTSQPTQLGELLFGLDPFGDRPKAEGVRQGDDGGDDGRVARVTAQPVDEGLVDLQHVD